MLRHHAQPEVLEHGQDVGDRDRITGLQDAQPQARLLAAAVARRLICGVRGIRSQRLEVGDVVQCLRGVHVRAIGRREQLARSVPARSTASRSTPREISACCRRSSQVAAAAAMACSMAPMSSHGRRALRRAHQQVQSCQHGIRDLHLAFHVRAVETFAHDAFDALAHLGVVAVARHEHQAGVEALVAVTPHEQTHAAALVEVDDAADDRDELGGRCLEQFVARKGLDHVDHGLGVVALRGQAEVRDDRIELAPEQRDLGRRLVIGARSPQSEKAMLAGDVALRVEGLDAHVVEIAAAMHRRGCVRLGEHQ